MLMLVLLPPCLVRLLQDSPSATLDTPDVESRIQSLPADVAVAAAPVIAVPLLVNGFPSSADISSMVLDMAG